MKNLNDEGKHDRHDLYFSIHWNLYIVAKIYSPQNGYIHLNEKRLSGDRRKEKGKTVKYEQIKALSSWFLQGFYVYV